MNVVVFSHSLLSGRDHSNVRFLHGVIAELEERGHQVTTLEPAEETFDLEVELDNADLVLVHDRSEPAFVRRIGAHRARHDGYRLLFYDAHHQTATAAEKMTRFDLSNYDGVLANGEAIRRVYLERGWANRAWTWHEAADTHVFHPLPAIEPEDDLVWAGDWVGGEHGDDLREFLFKPARRLRLRGSAYGARFPRMARLQLRFAGLRYRGPVAGHRLPELFARHRLTVHVPPRPHVGALPGVPTIRPFEAMAAGIPLISAPWDDCEGLFRPEQDHLIARDCAEMREAMEAILEYPEFAAKLRESGLETIHSRHTCGHRVEELLAIDAELRGVSLEAA